MRGHHLVPGEVLTLVHVAVHPVGQEDVGPFSGGALLRHPSNAPVHHSCAGCISTFRPVSARQYRPIRSRTISNSTEEESRSNVCLARLVSRRKKARPPSPLSRSTASPSLNHPSSCSGVTRAWTSEGFAGSPAPLPLTTREGCQQASECGRAALGSPLRMLWPSPAENRER